tara:strand:+ start:2191 stop:2922 length:732 start_codon:yes stop_codon:yes gene_type:complete
MGKNNNEYWNTNETVLGLLGVAPYATIDFLKKISDLTPTEKDWDHIRIILDSNTKIPSRGRALDLGEESPVKYMREAIIGLKNSGADFVIILCNTAHIFYDEVVKELGVEVLNMITETLNYVLKNNKEILSLGVLGSNNTVKYKLYDKYCPNNTNLIIHYPDDDQKIVADIIERVKQGETSKILKSRLVKVADKLIKKKEHADGIILGCTELSTLLKNGDLTVPVFDSSEILAKVAINKIKAM